MFIANIVWGLISETDILSLRVHRSSIEDFTPSSGTVIATLDPDVREYVDTIDFSGNAEMIYYRVEAIRASDSLITEDIPFVVGSIDITTPVITSADYVEITATEGDIQLTSSPFEASFSSERHVRTLWELYNGNTLVDDKNTTTELTATSLSFFPSPISSGYRLTLPYSINISTDAMSSVYGTADNNFMVYKLDFPTGQSNYDWRSDDGIGQAVKVAYMNGFIYVTQRDKTVNNDTAISGAVNQVHKLNAINGLNVWSYAFPESTDQWGIDVDEFENIYINGIDGVRKIDKYRVTAWDSTAIPGFIAYNIIVSDKVYASSDTKLVAFNINDGSIIWENDEVYGKNALILDNDGNILTISSIGRLVKISPDGNLIQEIGEYTSNADEVYDIDIDGDGIIYMSKAVSPAYDSYITAIKPNDGSVFWESKDFPSNGICYVPNSNLLGSCYNSNNSDYRGIRRIEIPVTPNNLTARVKYYGSSTESEWSELYPVIV